MWRRSSTNAATVARQLGAVNCIVNRDGRLFGTNTDGEGFVASLARGADFTPAGRRCLVIGAGGAARAVILALAEAGASEVAVLNRTPERAAAAAALAGVGRVGRAGGGRGLSGGERPARGGCVGRSGRQRHALGHGGRLPRGRSRLAGGAGAAAAGTSRRRPGLRPPADPVAGGGRCGGGPSRGRARHAGAPGGRTARVVDGAAGSRRGHVAGRGGGRSPASLLESPEADPVRSPAPPATTGLPVWPASSAVAPRPARAPPWPTPRVSPRAARG